MVGNGLKEGFGRAGKSSVLTGHFLNNLSSQKFSLGFHRSSDHDPNGSQISRKPGGLILISVLSCSILILVDCNKSKARSNHQFYFWKMATTIYRICFYVPISLIYSYTYTQWRRYAQNILQEYKISVFPFAFLEIYISRVWWSLELLWSEISAKPVEFDVFYTIWGQGGETWSETACFYLLPFKRIQLCCSKLCFLLHYQTYTRFIAASLAMAYHTWPPWTSLWKMGSKKLLWNILGILLELGWSVVLEASYLSYAEDKGILDKIRKGKNLKGNEMSNEELCVRRRGCCLVLGSRFLPTVILDVMFKCSSKYNPYSWCFLIQNS